MTLRRSKRIKIISLSTILGFVLILLLLYLMYAKQTHAVLVKFSNMKQIAHNVYVEPDINESEQAEVSRFVQTSAEKIKSHTQTNGGKEPVDFNLLDSHSAFQANATSTMNYELACYEVSRWYGIVGTPGLLQLIDSLNKGEDFSALYKGIENNGVENTK